MNFSIDTHFIPWYPINRGLIDPDLENLVPLRRLQRSAARILDRNGKLIEKCLDHQSKKLKQDQV